MSKLVFLHCASPNPPNVLFHKTHSGFRITTREIEKVRTLRFELFLWLGWRDSNPRMHGPKPCALPLGHTPKLYQHTIFTSAGQRKAALHMEPLFFLCVYAELTDRNKLHAVYAGTDAPFDRFFDRLANQSLTKRALR